MIRVIHRSRIIACLIGISVSMAGPALARTGLRGDVDQSGTITTLDATMALRASIGLIHLTDTQKLLADANGDGVVNTLDTILILRRVVGLAKDLGSVTLPSNVKVYVNNNETVFKWPATGKKVAGMKFTQGDQSMTIAFNIQAMSDGEEGCILSKAMNHFATDQLYGNDFTYFKDFVANETMTADVFVADSTDGPYAEVDSQSFAPVAHVYSPGVYGDTYPEISLQQPFPDTANVGDTITVSGTALKQFANGATGFGLRADAFYIPPSGIPESIRMASSSPFGAVTTFGPKINPGSDFIFQFKIAAAGPNIVEINDYPGGAALNRTIYVGGGIPLIPGVLDYQQVPSSDGSAALDVAATVKAWLDRINQDRTAYGLAPLTLDDKLSAAAQAHTDDMSKNNYFGHIGLDNSDPTSRAIAAGVPIGTNVGENIVQADRADALEDDLMSSAVHRNNILNSEWSKVGLGVTLAANGFLNGAQEFGADPGDYKIAADFFDNITLDAAVPSAYVTGTTYAISGKASDSAKTIILVFQNVQTQKQVIFPDAPVTLSDDHRFSIDVKFDPAQTGVYLMAIILDGAGGNATYVVVNAPTP